MNEIPSTWVDVTDDVCPRPRHGFISPEPYEEIETPKPKEGKTRERRYRVTMLETIAIENDWACEADMLRDLRKIHPSTRDLACALGVAANTIQKAFVRYGMNRKVGKPFGVKPNRRYVSAIEEFAKAEGWRDSEEMLPVLVRAHKYPEAIAKAIGVSSVSVIQRLRKYGIEWQDGRRVGRKWRRTIQPGGNENVQRV